MLCYESRNGMKENEKSANDRTDGREANEPTEHRRKDLRADTIAVNFE